LDGAGTLLLPEVLTFVQVSSQTSNCREKEKKLPMCSSLVQLFAPNPSSIARLLRTGYLFLVTGFALLVVSSIAHAVSPPPGGGYPNQNTAAGDNALFSLTTGTHNTATGFQALFSNTTGDVNTATGSGALQSNTTGGDNTAVGFGALFSNINGSSSTAVGADAMIFNLRGSFNTALGTQALHDNSRGSFNTAIGVNALFGNSDGRNNTATGFQALGNNGGSNNTATGFEAMENNLGSNNTAAGFRAMFFNIGFQNTATGFQALFNNDEGSGNTASGANALLMNNDGSQNTATGMNALRANTIGTNNVADGAFALSRNTTGSSNIALGFNAGSNLTTGSNNIDIGALGAAVDESNTIRIGRPALQKSTFIAGIFGVAISGTAVVVNSSGKLGVTTSSARFKDDIKPMGKASEAMLALKPVTFRYKQEFDPDGVPQFGLIAEEVEKINPDLVVRGEDGKVMTVRYEAVNAMLLNEFLKEHRKVEEQGATIAELKSSSAKQAATVAQQQQQIETLTDTVRKISERVTLSRPAPKIAASED